MCTSYFLLADTREIRDLIEAAEASKLTRRFVEAGKPLLSSGVVRPTDVVPVIAPDRNGSRSVFPMKWGFQIPGRSLLVNARSETAAVKPTFSEAWTRRRCVIPASWYFEWEHFFSPAGKKKTGDKYVIQAKGAVTWRCGLYRIEEGLPVFVVLTREPGEEIRFIHDRMPLIMPEHLVDEWIRPDAKPEELLQEAMTEMVFEKAQRNEAFP